MKVNKDRKVQELTLSITAHVPNERENGGLSHAEVMRNLTSQAGKDVVVQIEGLDLVAGRYACHVEQTNISYALDEHYRFGGKSPGITGPAILELELNAHDLADDIPEAHFVLGSEDLNEILDEIYALVPESYKADEYVQRLVRGAAKAGAKKAFLFLLEQNSGRLIP